MSPFNLQNYTALLQHALRVGYRFIAFDQVLASESVLNRQSDKTWREGRCLIRHDVDADLAAAVVMARAEAAMGICATYFLMWRSPCYNLMSRSGQRYAEEILGLGHKIGLHYDQGFDELRHVSSLATGEQIRQQANWLETLLHCRVSAVSFHQPSQDLLQAGVDCGERLNTYDRERLRDFRYISDSNRRFPLWSAMDIEPAIEVDVCALACFLPQDIQLLIHPMWWVYNEPTTQAVWDKAILSNLQQTQQQLLRTERAYGPRREFRLYISETENNSKQTWSDGR